MNLYKAAGAVLVFFVIVSVFAPFLAPYDPYQIDMSNRLLEPSGDHLMGTDSLGRDVLSRLIYGGRTAIFLSVLASALTMFLGMVLGILAGYFGGRVDSSIQVLVSIFQALPSLSFMIAIIGVLGPGIKSILISVVLTSWADFSRIVRGEVLKVREKSFIEGAKAMGGSSFYIIVKHLVPNILGAFVVLFTTRIGKVVLSIAGLSFLGLGLKPPTADWGVMINDAKTYYLSHQLLIVAPGFCIMAVSLSINLLGDALRDHLDKNENACRQYL